MADTIATLVTRLVGDDSGLKATLDGAKRDLQSFGAQTQNTSRLAQRSFQSVTSAWRMMAGSLAAIGVTATFGALINDASQFERQMIIIRATSGATESQMRALSTTVRRVGNDFRVGARAAASAAYELQKSGISLRDINEGALQSAVTLAQALGGNFADSASVAATAMQVFREDADRLDAVIQGVTGTVLGGRFELADYTVALQQGGGAARNAGLGLEDFNAALLLIQRNIGSSGSDTGTALRTFLSRLTPQSNEAAAAMARLGLSFYDATGQFVGLEEAANRIRVAFSGLSDEARNRNLNEIFGVDAMRVAVALYNEGSDGVVRFRNEVNTAANAAEIAQSRTEGFAGATANLSSAFQDLGASISESGIMSLLASLTNWAAGGVRAMSGGLREINERGLGAFQSDPLIGELAQWARINGMEPAPIDWSRFLDPQYDDDQRYAEAFLGSLDAQGGNARRDVLAEMLTWRNTSRETDRFATYGDTPLGRRLRESGIGPPIVPQASFDGYSSPSNTFIDGQRVYNTPWLNPPPIAQPPAPIDPEEARRRERERRQRADFYEGLADDFAYGLSDFTTDAALEGGEKTADAFWDSLEREFAEDGRAERLNESAAQFGAGVAGAFESAFVNWNWDFETLADNLGREWNQLLWDVFIGDDARTMMESIANGLKNWLNGMFQGATDGGNGSTIGNTIAGLFNRGENSGSGWLGSALSAVGSMFGFQKRHNGGRVDAGSAYVIGKSGAEELFVPDVSGHVLPGQMRGASGGKSMSVHVTYDLTGANGDRQIEAIVARANAKLVGQLLEAQSRAAPAQMRQHALLQQ